MQNIDDARTEAEVRAFDERVRRFVLATVGRQGLVDRDSGWKYGSVLQGEARGAMDHETGRTIRYVAKVAGITAGVVLSLAVMTVGTVWTVSILKHEDHWWSILPELVVPLFVSRYGIVPMLAWWWRNLRSDDRGMPR